MFIYLPPLVCIIGLLIYALAGGGNPNPSPSNPKIVEIGRIMFKQGLLVTLALFAWHNFRL